MNTNDMISKIKEVLNLSEEVKLEQLKLENGTVLEADEFKAGAEIFILTEDEKVAVPVGEYELEDGRILSIKEEGVISELKEEKEEEAPYEEKEEKEEEKEEMGYATKEELAEVKQMIEEIKAMLEPKEEEEKEEMSEELNADELGNLMTEELCKHDKVELSEVPQEVQEELNQPAAEPIKANPEVKQNLSKFNISENRRMSTLDRVMAKLNN